MDDIVVSGTSAKQMGGMCKSIRESDMPPDHLFATIGQAMLNAFNSDAVSGLSLSR